jgi:methyl-accepting chemotaxis protein
MKAFRVVAACALVVAGVAGSAAVAIAEDGPPGVQGAAGRLDVVMAQALKPGLFESLTALRGHAQAEVDRHVGVGAQDSQRMAWALGAVLVLCVAAGIAAAITVERTVVSPLDRAARMLEAISESDAGPAQPLDVDRLDEVSEAARSFSAVIGKMQDVVGRVKQATAQASTAAGQVAAVTRDVARGATDHASSLALLASAAPVLTTEAEGLTALVGPSGRDDARLSPGASDRP